MDSIKREVVLTDSEVQGLDRMRELNEGTCDYLNICVCIF